MNTLETYEFGLSEPMSLERPDGGDIQSKKEPNQEILELMRLLESDDCQMASQSVLNLLSSSFDEQTLEELTMHLPEVCRLLYSQGHYDVLERLCYLILNDKKLNTETAYEYLARIAVHRHQYREAQQFLAHLDPKGISYAMVSTVLWIRKRDVRAARSSLNNFYSACEENETPIPDEPELMACEVLCQFYEGRESSALAKGREVWEECQGDTVSMLLLAEVFVLSGKYGEGAVLVALLQKMAPDHEQVHALSAKLAFDLEKYDVARYEAERCLEQNPVNNLALDIQVQFMMFHHQHSEAEAMLKKLSEDSQENLFLQELLGDLYFSKGQYEQARTCYAAAQVLIHLPTSQHQIRMARLNMIDGKYHEAAITLEEVLPKAAGSLARKAAKDLVDCYQQLGEYEKAKALMQRFRLRVFFEGRYQQLIGRLENTG